MKKHANGNITHYLEKGNIVEKFVTNPRSERAAFQRSWKGSPFDRNDPSQAVFIVTVERARKRYKKLLDQGFTVPSK